MSYFQSCKGVIELDVCLIKTTAAKEKISKGWKQALVFVYDVWGEMGLVFLEQCNKTP